MPSRAWGGRRRREILFGAAAIAVLFHVLLTAAIVEAPHLWPAPPPPPAAAAANQEDPPTIEMVMDQNRYAGGATKSPPASSTQPSPPAPQSPQAQGAPTGLNLPPATKSSPDTVPPDAPKQQTMQAPSPSQAPPNPNPAQPQVNLDPADGLGYGHQDDPHDIPASPDDKNANKMPPYPRDAGRRGEEGSVQMLVSIAADGEVSGVEVAVSSGYSTLDRTARDAVSHWHFRPAIRDGLPVPTQLMQTFNFKIDR